MGSKEVHPVPGTSALSAVSTSQLRALREGHRKWAKESSTPALRERAAEIRTQQTKLTVESNAIFMELESRGKA